MSDFVPIQTQEDFDKAIKGRLAQKDREAEEKYKDFMSPEKVSELKADYEKKLEEAKKAAKDATDKLSANEKTVADLTTRIETAENSLLKNTIAYKHKLPLELASRLVGTNEEELTKDAESLSALMKPSTTAPLHSTNPSITNKTPESQALIGLLSQIKGETN